MIKKSIHALLLGVAVSFTLVDGNAMDHGYMGDRLKVVYEEDIFRLADEGKLSKATLSAHASADVRNLFYQMKDLIRNERSRVHIPSPTNIADESGYMVRNVEDIDRLVQTGEILNVDPYAIRSFLLQQSVIDAQTAYAASLKDARSRTAARYEYEGVDSKRETSVRDLRDRHQRFADHRTGAGGSSTEAQEYAETVKKSGVSVKDRAKLFGGGNG